MEEGKAKEEEVETLIKMEAVEEELEEEEKEEEAERRKKAMKKRIKSSGRVYVMTKAKIPECLLAKEFPVIFHSLPESSQN